MNINSKNFIIKKDVIDYLIKFILLILFSLFRFVHAQNLVPNSSFENLKSYPSCWTFSGKTEFDSHMMNWILPNEGTTDILSTDVSTSCITSMPYSTYPPVNWFPRGSQIPRTGSRFIGVKPFFDERREYLEVKLTCPLVPGQEYYCEMYVSLSENTNYAQNSLGMYFSDTLVYVNSTAMLNFTPQIVENAIIEDTVNWVRISGTFIPSSPSQYLIIGSFTKKDDMNVKFLGHKGDIDFPYYFIDDVLVKPVSQPMLNITGDTIVCAGDTLHLDASGWNNLKWYSSGGALIAAGNKLNFKTSNSTLLTLKGDQCNWSFSRPLNIKVNPLPIINLGKDTLICQGTTITLDAGGGYKSYRWQNNSILQTLDITFPGTYSVEVIDNNDCQNKDQVKIDYYKTPAVNLGSDISTCSPKGILNVNSSQPFDHYQWQNQSTSKEFEYVTEGKYWVTVTSICGVSNSDTINIEKINMFVPNLVTANDDGHNDRFLIDGIDPGKGSLSVFNIYGSAVYKNENYRNEWNGGQLPDGVYYFQFNYPTCKDVKGWVQIIR